MPLRRVFVVVFAFVIVMMGAWAGAHFVRPLPEPRWTDTDLPALPPSDANVYSVLTARLPAPELDELIAEEGSNLDHILREGATRIADLRSELEPSAELRAAIRARPRYVEASGMLGASRVLEGLAAWKLRSLAVLLDTLDGRHDLAAEEVASMWTHSVDYASTCQSLISCMSSQRLLQLSLGSAELLARESPLDLEWLGRLIETTPLDRGAIRNGIIAEYVYARVGLESYDAPFLDRAQTDRMLMRHFETALDFADDARSPRPVADFRSSALWWLYNPAGKSFADGSLIAQIDQLIERFGREHDEIVARRDELVRSLGRATYGAAWQLAGEDPGAVPTLDASEPVGGGERE